MAKITLLDKSGYVLTTDKAILVFDYYKDPEKALEKLLKHHRELPVIFFTTNYGDNLSDKVNKPKHEHELPRYEREALDPNYDPKKHEGGVKRDDQWHFNHDMFNLAQDHQRVYVMPQDINANAIRNDVNIAWIQAGGIIDRLPAGITVKAYPTNVRGVSYLVTMPCGTKIFYAGDMSVWQDETDEKIVDELFNKFIKSLHLLEEDVDQVGIMFYPVDPRVGQSCYDQAKTMLQNIKVKFFVPMQYGQQVEGACNFAAYLPEGTTGLCLHSPSQTEELCPGGACHRQVPD